jgi:hypothetical protein
MGCVTILAHIGWGAHDLAQVIPQPRMVAP